MNKRSWILLSIILVLGAGYVYFFSGWLTPRKIRVVASLRRDSPNRHPHGSADPTAAAGVIPVVFSLDRPCTLTSVAVFAATDLEFEKDRAKPLWHMVADETAPSAPVRGFHYGWPIKGMKPADPDNPTAPPLLAGTLYRVVVDVGGIKGTTDFQTKSLTSQE